MRKHRKNDVESCRKLRQLQREFECLRTMLELVKRREKLKLLSVDLRREIFKQTAFDILNRTGGKRELNQNVTSQVCAS